MKRVSLLLGALLLLGAGCVGATTQTGRTGSTNVTTPSMEGLQIDVRKEGTGEEAKAGDTVRVHYTGRLEDGTVFDSSRDRGTPFAFTLGTGMVIRGWELGVAGMRVGEERTLTIAPELGYGASGAGGVIPPNATLIFDVELVTIQ